MLNKKRIEYLISELLKEFDKNPDRPGLQETPHRVAKYWLEMLEGAQYTNDEIAKMFDKCFEDAPTGSLVIEKNIPIFSHCEHHLALMYDCYVSIAYIPKTKVIYVIFPSKRGGYSAQGVPINSDTVELKKPFPKKWLTSLPDYLTFCHKNRFLISADSLDKIIYACNIALKEVEK